MIFIHMPETPPPIKRKLVKKLQVELSENAYCQIKVAAIMTDRTAGDVVSELAERHLPPVEGVAREIE